MKKRLSMILSLMMAVVLLGACSRGGESEMDDDLPVLTLALRDGIYSDVITECVKEFEKKENVHCKILEMSEDELHSLVAQDAGQDEGQYDLCMVDGSWMAEYTDGGILESLTDLGYELDEDIISSTTEVCYKAGEVYLAPFYGNVTVLLYNKTILRQAGYDASGIQSLSEVLEICESAKKKGNLGFMYRGDSPNNYVVDFLPILLSYGGWVVDGQNRPTVDTPEFKKAMEFYLKLIATGKAESRDNLTMAIANNGAAMAVGWPGWYTPGKKSTADYCAITGKASDDSIAHNANVYGIWTLGIPANSTQKEQSIRLLKYLMDPQVQRETVSYGGVPCRYSSLRDEAVLEEFPQYEAVCNALENGIYRPIMVEWPLFYQILGEEMGEIIKGNKSVEQGLKSAQEKLDAQLHTEG